MFRSFLLHPAGLWLAGRLFISLVVNRHHRQVESREGWSHCHTGAQRIGYGEDALIFAYCNISLRRRCRCRPIPSRAHLSTAGKPRRCVMVLRQRTSNKITCGNTSRKKGKIPRVIKFSVLNHGQAGRACSCKQSFRITVVLYQNCMMLYRAGNSEVQFIASSTNIDWCSIRRFIVSTFLISPEGRASSAPRGFHFVEHPRCSRIADY